MYFLRGLAAVAFKEKLLAIIFVQLVQRYLFLVIILFIPLLLMLVQVAISSWGYFFQQAVEAELFLVFFLPISQEWALFEFTVVVVLFLIIFG